MSEPPEIGVGGIYAWRIRDHVEDRDYLTLSASEVAHYESISDTTVTIVSLGVERVWEAKIAEGAMDDAPPTKIVDPVLNDLTLYEFGPGRYVLLKVAGSGGDGSQEHQRGELAERAREVTEADSEELARIDEIIDRERDVLDRLAEDQQPWEADVLDNLNESARLLEEHGYDELRRRVGQLYQDVGRETVAEESDGG